MVLVKTCLDLLGSDPTSEHLVAISDFISKQTACDDNDNHDDHDDMMMMMIINVFSRRGGSTHQVQTCGPRIWKSDDTSAYAGKSHTYDNSEFRMLGWNHNNSKK